jgi:hypothetical protein
MNGVETKQDVYKMKGKEKKPFATKTLFIVFISIL